MNKKYTDLEQMQRVWAVETIKDLMSRRAMYSAFELREQELNELWVSSPENMETASFGRNGGFYVGMNAIRSYYVKAHKKRLETSGNLGCMESHPVSTPHIVLAEDGMSARGMWYSIGHETYPDETGVPRAVWVNDKIGADFLLENGKWKIWHLMISNDIWQPVGKPIDKTPVFVQDDQDYVLREFGEPSLKIKVHDPVYLWSDDYPPLPVPYKTMSQSTNYGPDGYRKKGE